MTSDNFTTPWEDVNNGKRQYLPDISTLKISPPLYRHPLTITYTFTTPSSINPIGIIQTNIAYKIRFSVEQTERLCMDIVKYRNKLVNLCKEHDILISRFNPLAMKTSTNKWQMVLVYKEDTLLDAANIRHKQIIFSQIRKFLIT